jgi:2,5-diketo-D-gluconate reductase A
MSASNTLPSRRLNSGSSIPVLGFGTWQISDSEAAACVASALRVGYRHIDTAAIYKNERGVGEGIRLSGLPRDNMFVVTKVWNSHQGRDLTLQAFDTSLAALGLETVDLYLIHWPAPRKDHYVDTWRALVELHKSGRVGAIGVSNFNAEHIARVIDATGVVPSVNQIELHPWFQQRELRALHDQLGIVTESWSPLGRGKGLLDEPALVGIAARLGVTAAQVVIAWHLARNLVTIPKTVQETRAVENLAGAQVILAAADVAAIDALDRGAAGRIGPDPATADF